MSLQFINLFIIIYDAKTIKYLNEITKTYYSTSRQMVLAIYTQPEKNNFRRQNSPLFANPTPLKFS